MREFNLWEPIKGLQLTSDTKVCCGTCYWKQYREESGSEYRSSFDKCYQGMVVVEEVQLGEDDPYVVIKHQCSGVEEMVPKDNVDPYVLKRVAA